MVNSRAKLPDIIAGHTYGRLTAIHKIALKKGSRIRPHWICKCACGNTKTIDQTHLKRQQTLSCGCLQKERAAQAQFKHGLALTRIHNAWRGMMRRCYDSSSSRYERYGGRGITVCEEWHKFEQFVIDMYPAIPNTTLDRIDNEKGYSKDNCRWATRHEQANNTCRNKMVEFCGKIYTIAQLSRFLNCSVGKLRYRISKGLPLHGEL